MDVESTLEDGHGWERVVAAWALKSLSDCGRGEHFGGWAWMGACGGGVGSPGSGG